MMPLKCPEVRPLPQSTAFTPTLYCARNPTICICTLPFPCRLLCHGQLRADSCERGRGYGPELLRAGGWGAPRKLDRAGHREPIVPAEMGEPFHCCLCCPSLPCSDRRGSPARTVSLLGWGVAVSSPGQCLFTTLRPRRPGFAAISTHL